MPCCLILMDVACTRMLPGHHAASAVLTGVPCMCALLASQHLPVRLAAYQLLPAPGWLASHPFVAQSDDRLPGGPCPVPQYTPIQAAATLLDTVFKFMSSEWS